MDLEWQWSIGPEELSGCGKQTTSAVFTCGHTKAKRHRKDTPPLVGVCYIIRNAHDLYGVAVHGNMG